MSTTNKQPARQEGQTPRTDAAVSGYAQGSNGTAMANTIEFARTLERELSAKQAELESLKAAQGWRTISEAPRDKPFIGLMEDGLVFRTKFQLYRTYPTKEESEEHGWRGFHPTRMDEGWSYEDGDSLSPCRPVGWMPLPTPPVERSENKG